MSTIHALTATLLILTAGAHGEVLVGSGAAACTHPLFSDPEPTGAGADEVVTGDLNGDGREDIASVAHSPGGCGTGWLRVLLTQEEGGFAETTYELWCAWPKGIALGDFDEASGLDIAISGEVQTRILLNQGDGSFVEGPQLEGGWFRAAVGDLDGVNGPDLVGGGLFGDYVEVWLNQGGAVFAPPVSYPSSAFSGSRFPVVRDLDGSNGPDIAVGNRFLGGATVGVLLNQGDGTFAPFVEYATGGGDSVEALTAADLDGFNGADLVVGTTFETWVLLNQGDGTFEASGRYGTDGTLSVAVGDLDGANGLDVVVGHWDGAQVLLNQGDGTLGDPMDYEPFHLFDHTRDVAVGDMDGSNGPDLVVGNVGGVWLMLNTCQAAGCPWDLNSNGFVWFLDLLQLLFSWGPCDGDCPADFDDDGFVGILDFLEMLTHFGPCP
jgi:hypothetical protein